MSGSFPSMQITLVNGATCGSVVPPFPLNVAGGANVQGNLCVSFNSGGTIINGDLNINSGTFQTTRDTDVAAGTFMLMNNNLGLLSSGINATTGVSTLTAGTTGAITNNVITANGTTPLIYTVRVANATPASNTGHLAYTTSGNSFTINSSNPLDNGKVGWYIFKH